jgi:hypothetical protein
MTLDELRLLSGVSTHSQEINKGSNISVTGTEKRRIEREQNIKPGTDDWFRLWFSLPKLTGDQFLPSTQIPGIRSRK